jgi:RNA ligase (TIGR02306 family)
LNLTETDDNSFWQVARKYDLRNKMTQDEVSIAIQGELVGPGVQGNKYGLSELDLYVFNIYSIDAGRYINTDEAKLMAKSLGLQWVPFVTELEVTEDVTVDSLLALAEGKSVLNAKQEREGLVWRTVTEMELHRVGRVSFKTISNKFLLSGGE